MVLKEFNSITTFNKDVLIWYFRDYLCSFIQAQLDEDGTNLDTWDKNIEKTINTDVKVTWHLLSSIQEINEWYPQCPKPVKTKENLLEKKLAKAFYSFSANLRSQWR